MTEKEQSSQKEKINLSDEFKKEIKERKRVSNWFGLVVVVVVFLAVFGSLGVGTDEIFFKPEKLDQRSSQDKIESKPTEDQNKTEQKKEQVVSPTPVPAPTPVPQPASTTEEYVVVDGDTLGAIAAKFSTTVEKLKQANSITDEASLQIGQKLKIVK